MRATLGWTPVERLVMKGGARLAGEVTVGGAKNSALKLMAAALLAEGRTRAAGVPVLLVAATVGGVPRRPGCRVEHDASAETVVVDVPHEVGTEAAYDLVRRMRAS